MTTEYWSRWDGSSAIRSVSEFDGDARSIEVSVELWRDILAQLGFVKMKSNPCQAGGSDA